MPNAPPPAFAYQTPTIKIQLLVRSTPDEKRLLKLLPGPTMSQAEYDGLMQCPNALYGNYHRHSVVTSGEDIGAVRINVSGIHISSDLSQRFVVLQVAPTWARSMLRDLPGILHST